MSSEPSNASREMERGLLLASADGFEAKVQPSMLLSQHCGNMYAGEIPMLGSTSIVSTERSLASNQAARTVRPAFLGVERGVRASRQNGLMRDFGTRVHAPAH